jgi:hypothetical protein
VSNWENPRKAASKCDVSVPVVKRLMRQELVSVRRIPGGRPEVDVNELRQVIEQATRRVLVAVR